MTQIVLAHILALSGTIASGPATAIPCTLAATADAAASPSLQDAPKAESFDAAWTISAVSLHQGRAMVSRLAAAPEREGLFEMRFVNLPASVDPDSLQATVSAPMGGAKLLDVRYETTTTPNDVATNPDLRRAIDELEVAKRRREALGLESQRLTDQNALLAAIAAKTATESAKDFGSKSLDPAALAAQVDFLSRARQGIIAERLALDEESRKADRAIEALNAMVQSLGGQTRVERTAIVTVGKSSAATAGVTLKYLVGDATWSPRYAVRADVSANALIVEYDAQIRQATGEDWIDVALTLSTAQPTQRAQPNAVAPVAIDIVVPARSLSNGSDRKDAEMLSRGLVERDKAGRPGDPGAPGTAEAREYFGLALKSADMPAENAAYKAEFADAAAVQSGTVATFPLPRRVSIPSDASKDRSQRIATIELTPTFVYVAQPVADSSVFLKATAANTSAYQLLAGPAAVFLGAESVGRAALPDLSPGSEMTFWLGSDRRLEVKRSIVAKESLTEGVFDKRDLTRWRMRVELTSTLAEAATVELFDRIPVSRNEQVKVTVPSCVPALEASAKHLKDERPFGIFKWIVPLPAQTKAGEPARALVEWTLEVSRPVGASVSGLPE